MTLIDEARHWWRMWSVRLAALAGLAASAIVAQPQILTGLVAYVPDFWRPAASAITGLIVFALPTATRLLKQGGVGND